MDSDYYAASHFAGNSTINPDCYYNHHRGQCGSNPQRSYQNYRQTTSSHHSNPYFYQNHPSGYFQTLASGIFSTASFSGTTPTLTPTTLHNIEQSFMQYQPNSTPVSISGQYNAPHSTEGGFVTPVIHPAHNTPTPVMVIKSEQDDFYYDDSSSRGSDTDYSIGGKRQKGEDGSYVVPNIDPSTYLVANSRRPTGPRKHRKVEPVSCTLIC